MNNQTFQTEVAQGKRFEFGTNWQQFLSTIDDDRIAQAERSLINYLGIDNLAGKTFLDIGCGSGLFSLAAMRLRAKQVHSFDFDPRSVACGLELKRRYFPNTSHWVLETGSALDTTYLEKLGQWDIVYSWGVLHHTGDMWIALGNVLPLVKEGGTLFISIYNDQGGASQRWHMVKAAYNKQLLAKWLIVSIFVPFFIARGALADLLRGKNPIRRYRGYRKNRGMSITHDWFDWLGGYPFEVAKPEQVFDFCHSRGFTLERLKTCGGGLGCNEYVFSKP